jgi:small subunit ribosomal protein S17
MSETPEENVEETPEDVSTSEAAEAAPVETDTQVETTRATSAEDTSSSAAPAVQLAPKERKRAAKAAKAAPARGQVSPEERHAERVADRGRKATVRSAGRIKAREKARAAEHRSEPTPPREHAPGTQKVRQGIVVSDKADKTITVRIDLTRRHRKYQKIVATSRTLHAHDESNDAHIGDTVVVRECRPLSRSKRWRLVEVVERAK